MAHKFKLIFLLSFTLLSIFGTTSFARVSYEYVDYTMDYLANNARVYEGELPNTFLKNTLNNLTTSDKTAITNYINTFLEEYQKPLLDDKNMMTFIGQDIVTEYFKLIFVFSNCTYPNGYDDIAFLRLYPSSMNNIAGYGNENSVLLAIQIEFKPSGYSVFSKEQRKVSDGYFTSFHPVVWNFLYNQETTVFKLSDTACCGIPIGYAQVPWANGTTTQVIFNDFTGNYQIPNDGGDDGEEGGEEGGGTGGDTGGGTITPDYSDDLNNIQTGITDINNNIGETNNRLDNISGELSNINNNLTTVPDISDTTITDDDITSNLDFEFEQDPYTNFWLDLTTGLGNAFTNNKREISIQFRDKTHIISLDNFSVQIPSALKPFLTIISTVFITWKMLQYIKIIVDNISSGNIDEVLEMNEEEGITNLF